MSHSARTDRETRAAYDSWARSYAAAPHNPLMLAEQEAMLSLWPNVRGSRALDLACGTGRYSELLRTSGASAVVSADLSAAMLQRVRSGDRVLANMMHLPFESEAFTIVVCALAVGHAADLRSWMSEIARILTPRGVVLYSDFHPEAVRAGMTRSFTDDRSRKWTLPHTSHALAKQLETAREVGFVIDAVKELRVGIEVSETFPGSEEFYRRWQGLPLVLVVRASKVPA